MDFPEPTALEISRANTGRRFYIVDADTYVSIVSVMDSSRGYPDDITTSVMPPVDELPDALDGSGKLVGISTFSVGASEEALLDTAIAAGKLEEIEEVDFLALMPPREDPLLEQE